MSLKVYNTKHSPFLQFQNQIIKNETPPHSNNHPHFRSYSFRGPKFYASTENVYENPARLRKLHSRSDALPRRLSGRQDQTKLRIREMPRNTRKYERHHGLGTPRSHLPRREVSAG